MFLINNYGIEAFAMDKNLEDKFVKSLVNIIFCWVMHEQSIIDAINNKLDIIDCNVIKISLTIDENNLRNRLASDIARGIRIVDVIDRSVARINMYRLLDTVKVDTNNKTVCEIANEIMSL